MRMSFISDTPKRNGGGVCLLIPTPQPTQRPPRGRIDADSMDHQPEVTISMAATTLATANALLYFFSHSRAIFLTFLLSLSLFPAPAVWWFTPFDDLFTTFLGGCVGECVRASIYMHQHFVTEVLPSSKRCSRLVGNF